jgi:hypothetical protein
MQSPLNSELLVGKCKYTIRKSLLKEKITIEGILKFVND